MEDNLKEYLKIRGIPSRNICLMENEKISMDTIRLLDPESLEKFIPKIGDRLAVLDFCSKNSLRHSFQHKRKASLLDKLRFKLNKNQNENCSGECSLMNKKFGAPKPTRTIDIGWMHLVDGRLVQVRSKQGGGTRKVSVNKTIKADGILDIGKKLFFVDDMSKKGHISKFSFILSDFKCQEINNDLTVEEMFNVTHLNNLRFYMTTFEKDKEKPSTITSQPTEPLRMPVEEVPVLVRDHEQSRHRNKKRCSNPLKSLENIDAIEIINLDEKSFSSVSSHEDEIESNVKSPEQYDFQIFGIGDADLDSVGALYNECENKAEYGNFFVKSDANELPSSPQSDISQARSITATDDVFNIILHRGNVVDDLINQFIPMPAHASNFIKLEVYLPNGELEKAEDVGGVFRDVLSEFWQEFCNKYTLGTQARVPVLRHDFNEQKWTAVAKILARGWKEEQYFPYQFSKCFMEACIFDEVQSDLIKDLFNFVSEMDSDVLKTALQNYNQINLDDLLDCLDSLECKWKPSEKNIKQLITDLAHKELIQRPTFIINQWSPVLKNILHSETFNKIYDIQKNLNKFVIQALVFEDGLTEPQMKVSNFLKKFVRESDHGILSNLLRFATGSNMLTPEKQITVHFVENTNDFSRTTTAHTCARTLNLPSSFDSYPDFRNEFKNLLTSEVWIMDII